MFDPLPDGGVVRKLWPHEADDYAAHLLRLDKDSRRRRFSGAVSDELIRRHAAKARGLGVVVFGFFVNCVMRGSAELRRDLSPLSRNGEAAFAIERDWQSHGVGSALLQRALLTARNRGIKLLKMYCLADNERMQQLARKFDAELKFDFGSVVGEVDPPRSTWLSLTREALADQHGLMATLLEKQRNLFRQG